MSAVFVLSPMSGHCPHTGLTIPECSCRECCRALVRHFAPELAREPLAPPPGVGLCTAAEYARTRGLSVAQLRSHARSLEVAL